MLNVIIADDDPCMRFVLRKMLSGILGVGILREASDGQQLVKMVESEIPDVIFLDIEMPIIDGIEAAKQIFDFDPKICLIFATAYDGYKSEAFEVYAFDYLIKPFNAQRIRQTMRRINQLRHEIINNVVRQCPIASNISKLKLSVQSLNGFKFINLADIIVITRFDRKTIIHTTLGISKTNESLQQIEDQINSNQFFRCHKGYIVNARMVCEIVPWGSKTYLVKLANTTETALMTFEKVKEYKAKYC